VPLRLGSFYAVSGQPREAIEALEDANRFFRNGTTSRALAVAYDRLGDFEAARAEYRRALYYDPGDIQARVGLATNYRDRGDYRTAVAEARMGLKLDPQNGHVRYVLGTSLVRLGQREEALDQLMLALHLLENDRDIAQALAEAATSAGRLDVAEHARRRVSAIEAVEQVTKLRRRSVSVAVGKFTYAIQRDPGYGYPHFELGQLYFYTSRPDLARQEFEAYLQKAPYGEAALQVPAFLRVLKYPSILAHILGRDPRFDVGI
jgi:tetratricopeptide (TPR) repeat protein